MIFPQQCLTFVCFHYISPSTIKLHDSSRQTCSQAKFYTHQYDCEISPVSLGPRCQCIEASGSESAVSLEHHLLAPAVTA